MQLGLMAYMGMIMVDLATLFRETMPLPNAELRAGARDVPDDEVLVEVDQVEDVSEDTSACSRSRSRTRRRPQHREEEDSHSLMQKVLQAPEPEKQGDTSQVYGMLLETFTAAFGAPSKQLQPPGLQGTPAVGILRGSSGCLRGGTDRRRDAVGSPRGVGATLVEPLVAALPGAGRDPDAAPSEARGATRLDFPVGRRPGNVTPSQGKPAEGAKTTVRPFGFETQELLDLAVEAEELERTNQKAHREELARQRAAFPDATVEELEIRVEAAKEMEEMEAHQREEDLAAEEEWQTLQRERAFLEQQDKFQKLKEAQQRRKSARLADWAIWAEEREAQLQQQAKEREEVANADWAAWTNSKAAEYDREQAQERARSFRDWENWVVLNEPPDAPRARGEARQRRQVRVEAGIWLVTASR